MWRSRSSADREALSRYWNALVRDVTEEELVPLAAALRPEQRNLIERLRSRERIGPDPAFVARLERDLLNDIAPAHAEAVPLAAVLPRPANGLFPSPFGAVPNLAPRVPRWSSGAILATVLLLAMAVSVAFLIVWVRPWSPATIPVVAPIGTPATPEAEPQPTSRPVHESVVRPVDVEPLWSADVPTEAAQSLAPQIAVDPGGSAWVIDGATNQFLIFGPEGVLQERWGESGSGPGQFAFRRENGEAVGSIAFTPHDPNGDFYVADSQNARIQQFAADRTLVREWGERGTADGAFLEPVGVTVGPDGKVYVIDAQRADVQVFDPGGEFLHVFGGPSPATSQLTQPTAGLLNQPSAGTFDPDGYLWIADTGNSRLQQFDVLNGPRMTIDAQDLGAGVIDRPQAIATDGDGRVYVTDRASHRVQVFRPDGKWLIALGYNEVGSGTVVTPYVDPIGLAFSESGELFVLDGDVAQPSVKAFQVVVA